MCIAQLSVRQLLCCLQTKGKGMHADRFCFANTLTSSFVELPWGFAPPYRLIPRARHAWWAQQEQRHQRQSPFLRGEMTASPSSFVSHKPGDLGMHLDRGDTDGFVWPASQGVQHPPAKSCSGCPGWQACWHCTSRSEWVWQCKYEFLTRIVAVYWVINDYDLLYCCLLVLPQKQHSVVHKAPERYSCCNRHVVEQHGSAACLMPLISMEVNGICGCPAPRYSRH